MDNEYTPTTEEVRNGWVCCVFDSGGVWVSKAAYEDAQWNERRAEAQFDRWLEKVRAEERERIAGLIDACWQGDKMDEWGYQNTLPDWRMGMSDAAHIVREAQS